MPTKIEIDGQTGLEDAMREFRVLSELNANLERQMKEFSDLNSRLAAENDSLRERVRSQDGFYRSLTETLTAHRDHLQRKCVALITRLSGIKETILSAERDAHNEETDLSPQEQAEVQKLMQSLPQGVHPQLHLTGPDSRLPENRYQ